MPKTPHYHSLFIESMEKKEEEKSQRQTSKLPLGQSNKIACAPMSSVVC